MPSLAELTTELQGFLKDALDGVSTFPSSKTLVVSHPQLLSYLFRDVDFSLSWDVGTAPVGPF